MPKKTAPKKRTGRPVKRKKSFFESLFSFSMPKMFAVVIGAVFLTLVFQYSPMKDVKGVSTSSDSLSQSQIKSTSNNAAAAEKYSFPKYVRTQLWRDSNENGVKDGSESCLPNKTYKYLMNGKEITATQAPDCTYYYALNKNTGKCVEIRFVNTLANYKFTAVRLSDRTHTDKVVKNKSVTLCGPSGSGEGARGGFVYNEVNFGVKAK